MRDGPLSRTIGERIERERRRLRQAKAVLSCLAFAANHDSDVDAGDVAAAAADLIADAISALDSVELKRLARE